MNRNGRRPLGFWNLAIKLDAGRRPEYIEAWWNVVNSDAVADYYMQAKK